MSSIQLSTLKIFWRYSHMFFLFSNKFSDYLVLIAELFALQVKFCLSDSWCYGLRVNCPTLSKHSSWEFFRILCVHVFNSIVDPQDFVALHSYVFFVFKQILRLFVFDSRIYCPTSETLFVWLLVLWPENELSSFVKKTLS